MKNTMDENKKKAIKLILLFGIISLAGDVIYEGARGVNGPYLETLGANAAIVGLVAGIGEFLGYAIRLVSGYFSDKMKAYWLFTIIGYSFLVAVPLLSLTGIWQFAAVFMVLERIGKGIRSPAKDTLLSHATKQVGTGFGFGIAEFLDQIGATIGPLIFTFLFLTLGSGERTVIDYQQGYSFLWFPFILLLVILFFAYSTIKNPIKLETSIIKEDKKQPSKLTKIFWQYSFFSFFTTMGFISFLLIGYHMKYNNLFSDANIPLFYSIAMVIDAIIGIVAGRIYDKLKLKYNNNYAGLLILLVVPIMTAMLALLVFSYSTVLIAIGIFIWGMVMGTHETIMKAGIADITPIKKRGTGYGVFTMIYGLALFIGSALAGFLYEYSIPLLVSTIIFFEIVSVSIFFVLRKEIKKKNF